jgi:hypothetical protein
MFIALILLCIVEFALVIYAMVTLWQISATLNDMAEDLRRYEFPAAGRPARSFSLFGIFKIKGANKMKSKIQIIALLAVAVAGCHAQVPPASNGYSVPLTATAPVAAGNWAGCTTSAPCTYAFYAETVSGACDPTTSANYKEITTPTNRPATPNFTDSPTTGLTRCYDVETVQGAENSGPSNVAGPVVSPGIPLAPALATPTTQAAELEKPAMPFSPLRNWQISLRQQSTKPSTPSDLRIVASR